MALGLAGARSRSRARHDREPSPPALGLTAWVLYVAVYTPLKRVTPWALEIRTIPGAYRR
jgi:heme O synthase-like polyprenyltransferase